MLILHYKFLESESIGGVRRSSFQTRFNLEKVNRLLDKFRETHPFDSLDDFLASRVQASQIWTSRDDSSEQHLSKHVILTYTKCNVLSYSKKHKCREVWVSRLNEKGTLFLDSIFAEFYDHKEESFFMVIFKHKSDMKHFKYLKHYFDHCEHEKIAHARPTCAKSVVFVVHKDLDFGDSSRDTKLNWEIDSTNFAYGPGQWQFVVIENLHDSYYK